MARKYLIALHLKDVQKSLDIARIHGQQVDLWCWEKQTGAILHYKGWWVISSHWRGGTHKLKNPLNNEIREVRDINIFRFNNHEVYV